MKSFKSQKRKSLVKELNQAGFIYKGGRRHEKWEHSSLKTAVRIPRHTSISPGVSEGVRKAIEKVNLQVSMTADY
jgi:hypothetical protein